MTCKRCGAPVMYSEHLPTEEHGYYVFRCGTVLDDDETWWFVCKERVTNDGH